MLGISHLDHLVLTVQDMDATARFYERILGFETITFEGARKALRFGNQKINLHPLRQGVPPVPASPTPGSADLCFITRLPIGEVLDRLRRTAVDILEGPVEKSGAVGPIVSVYFLDPDGNLIEVGSYDTGS